MFKATYLELGVSKIKDYGHEINNENKSSTECYPFSVRYENQTKSLTEPQNLQKLAFLYFHCQDLLLYARQNHVDSLTQDENEPETESLCPSTEEIVVPKSGLTRDGIWMYILNDNNLNQSIRIEQCLERDRSCRMISGLAHGYYTQCKQRYTYRQLWALNNEGAIVQDSFLFATSCCCHVKFRTDKFLKSFETKRFK
ncbi:hypothetical protein E2986_12896 [Frieseomelitta varia]|uniref:Spaetzle domain-containing protein n=1 Tax=Frieseomelitta varia TaxID=561572 RepID=A0A833RS71_9HYME|nr:hypothetical protein E2986_12896 [Frieseomelitta varia]